MKPNKGFSLVELLIVIVVIAIVAIIAIPNLLTARRAANEGSAISSLRTLHGGNMSYAASVGNGSYAGTAGSVGISSLTDLAEARFIDQQLATGDKSGYDFVGDRIDSNPAEPETFYFATNPSTFTGLLMTGTKRFGVETEGVIRSDAAPADLGIPFDEVSLPLAQPINNQ
jgi:type IV pilus assembly protein PilA